MNPDGSNGADWKDAAAYAPLLDADRSIFAWEWLRRDPGYRSAAARELQPARETGLLENSLPGPERWGLHAFEAPHQAAPDARPLWRAEPHPYVLGVAAEPAEPGPETFDLARIGEERSVVASGGREHVLISDGLRTIRLDIVEGSVRGGPARLRYRLTGLAGAEKPLLSLRRLLAFWRTGRFSRSLHPREARARRWILMLRAHDAITAGADQREIASRLLSAAASEPRWRSGAPSVRSQAQRLVRSAREMARGGYRELLR